MIDLITLIEDTTASALKQRSKIPTELIRETVVQISKVVCSANDDASSISEEDIDTISRRLQERFDINMPLGTLFAAEDYRPWLDENRGDISWYYWDRYKRSLPFAPNVITALDNITDQILDHLENPGKLGTWNRKGMVVGHVQSGKTANYTGLVCKAADSGYKIIIILAGMLNTLRNQTQIRLDDGFLGKNTLSKKTMGVGLLDSTRTPAYFTTRIKDFKKQIANQLGVTLATLNEPVLFVIKKNKNTLENLNDWLKTNNSQNLHEHPVLLIDDEADLASINTKRESEDATAINQAIRQLIKLFSRASYVGYTATPFANVFINPETDDEMLGDDLFPRDFILNLDPPSNYAGPSAIFSEDSTLDLVRTIKDHNDLIPLKHPKNWRPEKVPDSLLDAIRIFVLCRAVRLIRGQIREHNSMMVNVSRFTGFQSHIHGLIDRYLREELRPSINNYYGLSEEKALKNTEMSLLHDLWQKEYVNLDIGWIDIQKKLKEAVSPIKVIEVNSSRSSEPLDYNEVDFPNGRNVIAVGGLSLSRGLTLEGLTVSYFLRNSVMYDTLMQMGRWFGYRDDYLDLCRIYMTTDAKSWYQHISDVMDELRSEFMRMKLAGMSPKDFGLGVRSHPESLIVTARNKMRTGRAVLKQVNLEGRLVETAILINNEIAISTNLNAIEMIVRDAIQHGVYISSESDHLWIDVPSSYVVDFIKRFQNHPASQLTSPGPLTEYIEWLGKNGQSKWDVVLVSLSNIEKSQTTKDFAGYKVIAQKRQVNFGLGSSVVLNKHRVASRGQEKSGLSESQIRSAIEIFVQEQGGLEKKINIPDYAYRSMRVKPLLILHLLQCTEKDKETPLNQTGIGAFGISFCGETGKRRPQKLVEYMVNTVWWNSNYGYIFEDDEEEDDDED